MSFLKANKFRNNVFELKFIPTDELVNWMYFEVLIQRVVHVQDYKLTSNSDWLYF